MKKNEFLNKLEKHLVGFPQEDIDDLLFEYRSQIEERVQNGERETLVIASFGEPKDIVKEYIEEIGEPVYTKEYYIKLKKDRIKFYLLQVVNVLFLLPLLIGYCAVILGIILIGITTFITIFLVSFIVIDFLAIAFLLFCTISAFLLSAFMILILMAICKMYYNYNIELYGGMR